MIFYDNTFPLYFQMQLIARNPLSMHLKEELLTARRKNNLLAKKRKDHDDPEEKLQAVKNIYKIRTNQ